MNWDEIAHRAAAYGCTVERDAPMRDYTSFRIGGAAACLITPPTPQAAAAVLADCAALELPVTVIGNGSNLLVSDAGIDGVVLHIGGEAPLPVREGNTLVCTAALPLKQLCRFARQEGLSGLEPLYGIPGTVGGAVYMNAGAYGGEVAQTLTAVTAASRTGEVRRIGASELALSYRHSALMDTGETVLTAAFTLTPEDPAVIGGKMDEFLARRREKQPLEYPSAGSFFKRPEGHYAGALIEACGLKGAAEGDAQISEKHAGFLINRGEATCKQVVTLMRRVQETVWREQGVKLCPEVQFVGEVDGWNS